MAECRYMGCMGNAEEGGVFCLEHKRGSVVRPEEFAVPKAALVSSLAVSLDVAPSDLDGSVPENEWRKRRGERTQAEWAEALGCEVRTVIRWEREGVTPLPVFRKRMEVVDGG